MRILKPGSGIAIAVTAVCALAVSGQSQAPSPRYLYVNGQAGSRDTQVVNVIDTNAGVVVTGLATGVGLAESIGGLAVDDAGSTLYVSNATRRVVNVVSIGANALQATIPAEWHAGRLALSPDGKTLFALGQGGLAVIDTASQKVTRTITGTGNAPDALVVNPSGTRAYVTANTSGASSGHLAILDLAAGSVLGTVPVGNEGPRGLALNPGGSLAVVAAGQSGTVTFIDTAANAVAGVTTVSGGPQAVSFSPDGTRVLVASMNSNELTVLDVATRQAVSVVGNNIGSGTLSQPSALAFSGDGQFVLVANSGRTTVSVHDATTLQRAKPSIWVGGSPAMFATSAAFAGRPTGPAPSGPTLDDGQLNPWYFNQCRDSWDCGSAPACDPFTECSVDRYECRADPRHGGGTRCQWAATCGGCRSPGAEQ